MKIGIADPQARVRFSLRILLEQQPGWIIVGEAADSNELLQLLHNNCPNLILMDWNLPGTPMDDFLALLHEQYPLLQIITMSGRQEMRQSALNAGAVDFVSKTEPPERLLATIRVFQSGGSRTC